MCEQRKENGKNFLNEVHFIHFSLPLPSKKLVQTMKKNLFCVCVFLLTLTACTSASYVLESMEPHRIEVTKELDAQPVTEVVDFLASYRAGVDSLRAPYIGQSEVFMTAGRPESLLSNWVADALVASSERMGYQPDLGICNVGGLRASMPAGIVRKGDMLAISPFENFFTILKMRGTDVEQLMRDIAAVHGEGVSSSVRLVITRDGLLKSATIGGQRIDPDRIYTIATLDYLAEGNDKLYSFKNAVERTTTQTPVRETIIEQLEWLDKQGMKATAKIEGRIVETDEGESPIHIQQTVSKEVGGTETEIALNDSIAHGAGSTSLLLVHTNDTHSCIEPLNPLLADTAMANKGGYLRRAALLRELRASNPNLLLVDAGDFSQGSAYYSLYHGDVEVGLMNLMQYDAATIGNHEFDFGLENMARIFRMAEFPIVCCNYDFTGTPVEGLVKPYTIVERGGLKIGIFGVSPQLEGLVAAHTCEGVVYNNPITSAQATADYLHDTAQCDLIICLSHLGWMLPDISDEELISSTRYIDVVIGGHSHTYFASPQVLINLDGEVVPDNQMGKNARYVGTLRLNFSRR